jgi:hypothetical protein
MPAPGVHTIRTQPARGSRLRIEVDRTFSTAADQRKLGIMLMAAGYRQP